MRNYQDSSVLRVAALAFMTVGGLEWILGRTVSRVAAAPMLEGTGRAIIELLGRVGLFALPVAFLLAALVLVAGLLNFGSAADRLRRVGDFALALYIAVCTVLAAALSFFPPSTWVATSLSVLSAVAIWWLTARYVMATVDSLARALTVVLVALAYTGWLSYALMENLSAAGRGQSTTPVVLLNLGEVCAVAVPLAFFYWIVVRRGAWREPKRWIAPAVIALAYGAANVADLVADTGFTAVFAIYSVGLTLFLPWPIYAISLAAYFYSLLTCFASDPRGSEGEWNVGMGLLLLLFAGYALQLGYQHVLAWLSLALITGVVRPFPAAPSEDPRREIDAVGVTHHLKSSASR